MESTCQAGPFVLDDELLVLVPESGRDGCRRVRVTQHFAVQFLYVHFNRGPLLTLAAGRLEWVGLEGEAGISERKRYGDVLAAILAGLIERPV